MRKFCFSAAILAAAVMVCAPPVQSASLTVMTWNANKLKGTDLAGFGEYLRKVNPKVLVLQEVLREKQVRRLMREAGISHWNMRLSDFSRGGSLQVAILSPRKIGNARVFDPYKDADAKDMSSFASGDQRCRKPARGWLWAEIRALRLAVAAVHLKSSVGKMGSCDEENSCKRENVAAALAKKIVKDRRKRSDYSYLVAGDFNVAPGDVQKVGVDIDHRCPKQGRCVQYDQTHAILSSGLVRGLAMRNLTVGLGRSYTEKGKSRCGKVKAKYAASPIDNIYAAGPFFDEASKLIAERRGPFGSDHYAIRVTVVTETPARSDATALRRAGK